MDWVALPPLATVLYDVPVGFICDSDFIYYQENGKDYDLSINSDYKCKVVRLLPLVDTKAMDKSATFKVEIFSFETGEWRESTITSPREFNFNQINSDISFACNGMLYWASKISTANFIMGLDPFMIGDKYKCSFIEFMHSPNIKPIQCLSVLGGYLRMCSFDSSDKCVLVWQSEEEDDHDLNGGASRTLHVRDAVSYDYRYPLGSVDIVELIAFDPYDFDILYARGIHPEMETI